MRRNWLSMLKEDSPEKREGVTDRLTEPTKPRQNPKLEQVDQDLGGSVSFGGASVRGAHSERKPQTARASVWEIIVAGKLITVIDTNHHSKADFVASMVARFGSRFEGISGGDHGCA